MGTILRDSWGTILLDFPRYEIKRPYTRIHVKVFFGLRTNKDRTILNRAVWYETTLNISLAEYFAKSLLEVPGLCGKQFFFLDLVLVIFVLERKLF